MKRRMLMLAILIAASLPLSARNVQAAFSGANGFIADTYYSNPHVGETFVSFDWDANTNLYYTTGRPSFALGMSTYRYDGSTASNIYTDATVFPGSRIAVIGNRIYFNDGGDYGRWTFDYYKIDPATSLTPTQIIDSAVSGADLWGIQARGTSTQLWTAGGFSASIYYTDLDAGGDPVTIPPTSLGAVANSAGPMAFDTAGNLYYANGYVAAGNPHIYRWSAAEVSAAIADPVGSPLTPSNHVWATIAGGFTGASGMDIDDNGNVVLTATAFGLPGEVHRYLTDGAGVNDGVTVIATSPSRAETVRCRNGTIYVSDEDGIATVTYPVTPAQGIVVGTSYDNPHAGETFVSFDWGSDSNLYYTTGRPSFALGLSVYQHDGSAVSNIFTDASVFPGSRIAAIGDYVYFNDGGDYGRWTFDYFKIDLATNLNLVTTQIIDSASTGTDLWGLQERSGALWAGSGGSSASIQYTTLDANGNPVTIPPTALGTVGNSAGPMAFDLLGNLYYANGYVSSGSPQIYRWSAAEVIAALADPVGSPLTPSNHVWATIPGAFTGASGMDITSDGHVVLTATAFGSPGEVHLYAVDNGTNSSFTVLATTPNRGETVRCRDGAIHVSSAEGIFTLESLTVVVDTNTVAVPEGSSTTFDVKLSAAPLGTVTVNVSHVSGDADITVSGGASLVFTPGTWDTYQTVTLDAAEDNADNATGDATIVCDLDAVGGTDASVTATETDDDYTLTVTLSALNGSVGVVPSQTYYDHGVLVDLTVSVGAGHTFARWSGDASGTNNPLTVTMDSDKVIIARLLADDVTIDLDGDQTTDIACFDAAGIPGAVNPGTWYIMNSSGGFRTEHFGYAGTVPVVGDFDGDGQADLGVYDANGIPGIVAPGTWYLKQSTAGFRIERFGYPGTAPIVGDFDGDGTDDIGVYDASGIPGVVNAGTWFLMLSTDGFRTEEFGFDGAVPVVGNFDGDGADDFGCYSADGLSGVADPGTWYLMQSTAGFTTDRFGYTGTAPLVGDFDGDTIDDIGVYDAAGIPGASTPGSWYFKNSTQGYIRDTFGYAGTVPVVGDFDGDGTDDYGCLDAALGRWYIMQSTDGFRYQHFGYAGTVPVQ